MELRHLRNFVAIAEERSFTRAAERLWLAQPGLSAQIRRLEAELGVQLFARHTRGVDLTDAGELFLERARVTLAAADVALSTGHDLAAGLVGSLRIGLPTSTSCSLAHVMLETFARDRPNVEVTVVESFGGTLVRDVRDKRLDAAVVPAPFATPEVHQRALANEPLVVVVGNDHRLADAAPIAIGELDGEELVVTGHRDGAAYDLAVARLLEASGVSHSERRGGWGANLFATVCDGRAVAVTTLGTNRSDVVVRPLDPEETLQFDLVWRDDIPSPPVAALIRIAAEVRQAMSTRRLRARAAP